MNESPRKKPELTAAIGNLAVHAIKRVAHRIDRWAENEAVLGFWHLDDNSVDLRDTLVGLRHSLPLDLEVTFFYGCPAPRRLHDVQRAVAGCFLVIAKIVERQRDDGARRCVFAAQMVCHIN